MRWKIGGCTLQHYPHIAFAGEQQWSASPPPQRRAPGARPEATLHAPASAPARAKSRDLRLTTRERARPHESSAFEKAQARAARAETTAHEVERAKGRPSATGDARAPQTARHSDAPSPPRERAPRTRHAMARAGPPARKARASGTPHKRQRARAARHTARAPTASAHSHGRAREAPTDRSSAHGPTEPEPARAPARANDRPRSRRTSQSPREREPQERAAPRRDRATRTARSRLPRRATTALRDPRPATRQARETAPRAKASDQRPRRAKTENKTANKMRQASTAPRNANAQRAPRPAQTDRRPDQLDSVSLGLMPNNALPSGLSAARVPAWFHVQTQQYLADPFAE
ncbi:unnamed protein product [Boreogadus saida]